MVEAELESGRHHADDLGKQWSDPATAFPPLNKEIFASYSLAPATHETREIKKCQNRGPPAVAVTEYIYIARDHHILKSESFEIGKILPKKLGSVAQVGLVREDLK